MDRGVLSRLGVDRAKRLNRPVLVSWHVGKVSESLTELRRLIGHSSERTFSWSSPHTDRQLVAFGVAYEVPAEHDRWHGAGTAWSTLAADVVSTRFSGGPVLVGGGSYAATTSASMPSVAFWVPAVQYEGQADGITMTVNVVCRPDDEAAAVSARLATLAAPARQPSSAPAPLTGTVRHLTAHPDLSGWTERVHGILDAIRSGAVEKVVLAQTFEVEIGGQFDIGRILDELDARQAASIRFAAGWPDQTFLGASPELLLTVDGSRLRTIALAGSAARSPIADDDAALGQRLRDSVKERHEHALVVDFITGALRDLGVVVDVDPEPALVLHPTIQHLGTQIEGKLKQTAPGFVFDAIATLHPTPAVGGVPRTAALALQERQERLNRGWYAAPIGWVDMHGNAEIAVAIRSALVHPQRALVYAGCGIVAGSDPRAEYEEASIKAGTMLTALLPQMSPAADPSFSLVR